MTEKEMDLFIQKMQEREYEKKKQEEKAKGKLYGIALLLTVLFMIVRELLI